MLALGEGVNRGQEGLLELAEIPWFASPTQKAVQERGLATRMPSLRPLLPFTPSTTFSHRDVEQGVGTRSPRTPRLDAAFLAVPMRGVVLPGRFSTSPRDFSRFEHTTTSKQPARAF